MNSFRPGDRTLTPSGKLGTVQPAPWVMPMHTLVLPDGHDSPRWILTELLELLEPSPVTQIAQLNLFEDAA